MKAIRGRYEWLCTAVLLTISVWVCMAVLLSLLGGCSDTTSTWSDKQGRYRRTDEVRREDIDKRGFIEREPEQRGFIDRSGR